MPSSRLNAAYPCFHSSEQSKPPSHVTPGHCAPNLLANPVQFLHPSPPHPLSVATIPHRSSDSRGEPPSESPALHSSIWHLFGFGPLSVIPHYPPPALWRAVRCGPGLQLAPTVCSLTPLAQRWDTGPDQTRQTLRRGAAGPWSAGPDRRRRRASPAC